MNYFALYGLKESFLLEDKEVKKIYLALSKKYHPDFYTSASAEKQAEILHLSTLNNNAYRVLSNFDNRMKYILQEHGFLEEEEKYTLPQMFLMEMMDLHELASEVQFDPDPEKKQELFDHLESAEGKLMETVLPVIAGYNPETANAETFQAVKDFYYKRKYLLRIRGQMDKLS